MKKWYELKFIIWKGYKNSNITVFYNDLQFLN